MDNLIIGGVAGAGLLGFVLTLVKFLGQNATWKELIAEVRIELRDCRTEKGALLAKVATLEGEVISLRRTVHTDAWLGIDPESRQETRRRTQGGT